LLENHCVKATAPPWSRCLTPSRFAVARCHLHTARTSARSTIFKTLGCFTTASRSPRGNDNVHCRCPTKGSWELSRSATSTARLVVHEGHHPLFLRRQGDEAELPTFFALHFHHAVAKQAALEEAAHLLADALGQRLLHRRPTPLHRLVQHRQLGPPPLVPATVVHARHARHARRLLRRADTSRAGARAWR